MFSKEPEIYIYDELPKKLRVQVHHIIKETIGTDNHHYDNQVRDTYNQIRRTLKKEYGVFNLGVEGDFSESDVLNFLLNSKDIKETLDVIQLCFQVINTLIRGSRTYSALAGSIMKPDEAIEELNARFKENAVGYVFESNSIIRIDSTYTHAEIIKPTLKLLSDPIFQNANDEYLKAHDHYKHGRNHECLNECLKSFESVMKIIIKSKGWEHDERDTAKKLVQICFDKGLIPTYLQNQYTSLRAVLESGLPTIRNRVAGHGQGTEDKIASEQLVRYALNLTGSNIIFLVEQSKIL